MPLVMGDWKLFIDKLQLTFNLNSMNNRGRFGCAIDRIPSLGRPLIGGGYWNDISQQIYFTVAAESDAPNSFVNYIFRGYQIEGVQTSDPAGDRLWSLTGIYDVSGINLDLDDVLNLAGWDKFPRRQTFGWYAQITEII